MSHPNPLHDRSNEYPEDRASHGRKMALSSKNVRAAKDAHQKSGTYKSAAEAIKSPTFGAVHKAIKESKKQSAASLERPIRKMLDISDIGGKVGAKAKAIKKIIGKKGGKC